MIIERIEPSPRQVNMVRLHLADGTVIKTRDYVVADLGLYSGLDLDEDGLSALRAVAGQVSAKERAVRIVSAAGVSKQELRRRLTQKGEKEADAQAAVDWLVELQLLDDRKTAADIVCSAVAKGYGKARIKQILFEKRIPQEYWQEALAQIPEMDDAIDTFLQRRFHGNAPEEKELKKAIDALLRRGHSWQDIRAGLQRYCADLELPVEDYYE